MKGVARIVHPVGDDGSLAPFTLAILPCCHPIIFPGHNLLALPNGATIAKLRLAVCPGCMEIEP